MPVEVDDVNAFLRSGVPKRVKHMKKGSNFQNVTVLQSRKRSVRTLASSPSALNKLIQNTPIFPNLSFKLSKYKSVPIFASPPSPFPTTMNGSPPTPRSCTRHLQGVSSGDNICHVTWNYLDRGAAPAPHDCKHVNNNTE